LINFKKEKEYIELKSIIEIIILLNEIICKENVSDNLVYNLFIFLMELFKLDLTDEIKSSVLISISDLYLV
jgi:hypothetical protein